MSASRERFMLEHVQDRGWDPASGGAYTKEIWAATLENAIDIETNLEGIELRELRHRFKRIELAAASLIAILEEPLKVIECQCGHSVHSFDASYCGGCGRLLPGHKAVSK